MDRHEHTDEGLEGSHFPGVRVSQSTQSPEVFGGVVFSIQKPHLLESQCLSLRNELSSYRHDVGFSVSSPMYMNPGILA
jgi:hypothetical protein